MTHVLPPLARHAATHRRMVLSICLAAAVMPMTFTGGAIATPELGRSFQNTGPALSWVVNAFMMVFGALPLIAGALADRIGRRRVFRFGVTGFALTGVALALAPSLLVIDLLRGLQGVFAAATLAGGTAVLAQIPDEGPRRRAFSMIGATFGLGLAFGPLVAGWALSLGGWRGVFLAASALAVASLISGAGAVPESRAPQAGRFDAPGAALFAGLLCSLTAWAILVPQSGLIAGPQGLLIAAFVLLLIAFIAWERRCPAPMFDLTLLRDPAFLGVQALPVATCFGFVSLLVIVPVQLIGAGHSEVMAAAISLALSAPVFLVPMLLARFSPPRRDRLIAGGLSLAALGLFALGLTPFDGSLAALIPALLLIGLGSGLPWGLMDGLAIEVAPRDKAGVATGMFSTVRVASEGIVLALVSAIYAGLITWLGGTDSATASGIVAGGAVPRALHPAVTEACRALFWGLAALTLLMALLIRRRLGPR
ncbi:MFS transporter [Pseudooceanicola sp. CBS1P-1]|nr:MULTISPECIES: MFS transporter [Pseudooceanicola]MBT9385065.1 MFS transporter [Pseudooceanicola endophyticus]